MAFTIFPKCKDNENPQEDWTANIQENPPTILYGDYQIRIPLENTRNNDNERKLYNGILEELKDAIIANQAPPIGSTVDEAPVIVSFPVKTGTITIPAKPMNESGQAWDSWVATVIKQYDKFLGLKVTHQSGSTFNFSIGSYKDNLKPVHTTNDPIGKPLTDIQNTANNKKINQLYIELKRKFKYKNPTKEQIDLQPLGNRVFLDLGSKTGIGVLKRAFLKLEISMGICGFYCDKDGKEQRDYLFSVFPTASQAMLEVGETDVYILLGTASCDYEFNRNFTIDSSNAINIDPLVANENVYNVVKAYTNSIEILRPTNNFMTLKQKTIKDPDSNDPEATIEVEDITYNVERPRFGGTGRIQGAVDDIVNLSIKKYINKGFEEAVKVVQDYKGYNSICLCEVQIESEVICTETFSQRYTYDQYLKLGGIDLTYNAEWTNELR